MLRCWVEIYISIAPIFTKASTEIKKSAIDAVAKGEVTTEAQMNTFCAGLMFDEKSKKLASSLGEKLSVGKKNQVCYTPTGCSISNQFFIDIHLLFSC